MAKPASRARYRVLRRSRRQFDILDADDDDEFELEQIFGGADEKEPLRERQR